MLVSDSAMQSRMSAANGSSPSHHPATNVHPSSEPTRSARARRLASMPRASACSTAAPQLPRHHTHRRH
eukprot:7389226-Prymnesium_polylepis.1